MSPVLSRPNSIGCKIVYCMPDLAWTKKCAPRKLSVIKLNLGRPRVVGFHWQVSWIALDTWSFAKLFHASIRDVLEHLSQFEIFDKFLPEGFDKTGVLKNSQTSPRNACARASFLIKMQPAFTKKDTPAQMFSFEIYEVFKNTIL